MAHPYVPYGLYHGWTRQEVIDQLAKVDAAIKSRAAGSGQVQSASLGGKSISFFQDSSGETGLSALKREKLELMQALACVDDCYNASSDRTIADMTSCSELP